MAYLLWVLWVRNSGRDGRVVLTPGSQVTEVRQGLKLEELGLARHLSLFTLRDAASGCSAWASVGFLLAWWPQSR